MIPKTIHQIWKTKEAPEQWAPLVESWKMKHPEWEHKIWTDEEGLDFVAIHMPEMYDTYCAYPYDIQRADALRYLLVYHFGGLYVDMDFECLKPLDELFLQHDFIIGYEPDEHAKYFNQEKRLCNAIFAAVPGHYFLFKVIESLINETRPTLTHTDVLEITGPSKIHQVFQNSDTQGMNVLPASVLCPLADNKVLQKIKMGHDDADQIKNQLIKNGAFAIHYWSNSWVGNLAGYDLINPHPDQIEGFTFYHGVDTPGNDLFNGGRDIPALAKICFDNPEVVAFNTDGFAKSKVLDKSEWKSYNNPPPNHGLYIKSNLLS